MGGASWDCSQPTGGEAGGEMRNVLVFFGSSSSWEPIMTAWREREKGGEGVVSKKEDSYSVSHSDWPKLKGTPQELISSEVGPGLGALLGVGVRHAHSTEALEIHERHLLPV